MGFWGCTPWLGEVSGEAAPNLAVLRILDLTEGRETSGMRSRPAGCVLGYVIRGAGSWMYPGKLKGMRGVDTQVGLCGRDGSVQSCQLELVSWKQNKSGNTWN